MPSEPRRVLDHLTKPRNAAIVLGASVLVIAVLGLVSQFVLPEGTFLQHLLNLDAEDSVPAAFSGLLLLLGGVAALIAAPRRWAFRLFGLGLTYAAFDEVFQLHERFETLTGVNWIKLYAPVFVIAVAVVGFIVRYLLRRTPGAIPLYIVGLVSWGVAQVFEWFEWRGGDVPQAGYVPMMLMEEVLEDVGSAAFIVALLATASLARTAAASSQRVALADRVD